VLTAAQAGQGWAFERLFGWLGGPVSSYLRGAGAEDADGLANEVFLRVFTRMVDFQGGEGKFRSWVFTIAHHLLVDDQRRQRRRGRVVTLDEMPLSRQLDGADPAGPVR